MKPTVLYRVAGAIAVVILLVIPLASSELGGLGPLVLSSYFMHLAITAFFYAILASSWSLLAGYAGQFSFGHMAFMAIGGYTSGLIGKFIRFTTAPSELCTDIPLLGNWWLVVLNIRRVGTIDESCLDMAKTETLPAGTLIVFPPVWASIAMGLVMGAIFGLLVGWLVLRLRSTYLALFTIGFSEIMRASISAEIPITEGQSGLELVPLFPGGLLGFTSTSKIPPYYAMLLLFLVAMAMMTWLAGSRFGLFIRAIREDEEAAAALGVNIVRYKVLVFVITSTLAAAAGALQFHYIGIITPNTLIILQMSLVIAMAVIGGLENIYTASVGAIVITFVLELLRTNITIGPLHVDMTLWRLVFFGLLLMLTLRFQRNGLLFPILERINRGGVAAETVSIRAAPTDEEEEGEETNPPSSSEENATVEKEAESNDVESDR
ncbi:MAG: branched-chain amino acid ABC transporter permease [Caldilineaceae bacterium SB0664_bin_27]|uniref:Branched-chain amino acid ABC transporter permease n=1 Tax=Caldilineaceae bacterium SB0664_bin_27 TaxID=2605260 RepID=A0A6B0YYH6_9CHLR|nr:branched-chain amino acid ABC transporter permease [Caldilineaceae bacterium SB0664_bin_27]